MGNNAGIGVRKMGVVGAGFEGQTEDKTGTRSQEVHNPFHYLSVKAGSLGNMPFPIIDNFSKEFNALPGTIVSYVSNDTHSTGAFVESMVGNAPKAGAAPGVNSSRLALLSQTQNPINQDLPTGTGFTNGKDDNKDRKEVIMPNADKKFNTENEITNQQKHYGASIEERLGSWEKVDDIKTAEGSYGSTPSLGMLQGLPGMIMSLASSFSGLSKQQKNQIKSNTSPQMYSLIEATLSSTVDVGNYKKVSLKGRVHKETFANNMVALLSKCDSHADLQECIYQLRTDPVLQGKDQLPTVEYTIKNAFGNTGMIIDGYGNFRQNVSAEVAQAEADFMQFITQGTASINVLSKFEGQITANTLTVNNVYFGKLQKGQYIFIEGPDVTDNTQIASFGTDTTGNTGTYYLTLESNTFPNTDMILYSAIPNPVQESQDGGGGGGGGLGGLAGFFGQNIFGEASKLLGEQIPTMSPSGAAAVKDVLTKVKEKVAHAPKTRKKVEERDHGNWA